MDKEKYLISLKESIVNLDFSAVVAAAGEAMAAGVEAQVAITDGMVPGMVIVGEKFERGEYFLSELVVAGEVMKEGLQVIRPYMKAGGTKRLGTVVIATVAGDNHDLGKNIVTTLLGVHGFEVVDLGKDIDTNRMIAAVKERKADILAMSALLSTTMLEMGRAIEALTEAGLRERVKVIVGGSPVTPEFAEAIGADHCAADALEGVKTCMKWATPREAS